MPKSPISIDDFSRGLHIEGRNDAMPVGTMRRGKGIHPDITNTMKSRNGSTQDQALNSHSLFEFDDKRFQGATTILHRQGSSVKTGLDGTNLTFVKMPPTLGAIDRLFCSGGGDLFKVDTAGTATQWGIDDPTSNLSAAVGAAGALTGVYQYKFTFLNSVSGTRSNGNPTAASVTLSSERADLTAIAVSPDSQVDRREIWRTVTGGANFFLLTTINDNITTILTDNALDTTLGVELPVDSGPPKDTFEDCAGPHDGRMWWGRDTASGAEGRIYFSPTGKAESVEGFIDVTESDNGVQKIIPWSGNMYAIAKTSFYEISGVGTAAVFTIRELSASPGTVQPFTVMPTPGGIMYQAQDGIMVFDGILSKRVKMEQIISIFKGETTEGISAFNGTSATVTEQEYMISDGTTTLAYNFSREIWRNVGVGCNALFYEKDTGKIQASFQSNTLLLEDDGKVQDNTTAISIEWETPHIPTAEDQKSILRRLIIDADTQDESLTPTIIIDGVSTTLPDLVSSSRKTTTLGVMKAGNTMGLRLNGDVSKQVEIFRILFDAYVPERSISAERRVQITQSADE